ncbi:MAG TPA: hypothetical protein DCX14_01775 [Flavobacteriales bacterium]|nr:hypothetical protein [Flavobacteriales bacterium]
MKQILSLLTLILLVGNLIGQTDSTKVKSLKDYGKKPHLDMLLVDLNWDRLIGLDNAVSQKWYGRGLAVSLMYDYPLTQDARVSFAIGGGFATHSYYTDALVKKVNGTDVAAFQRQPSTVKEKGKISLNYVDVPLEFRFRTLEDSREHRWKLAVGGRVGYLINAHETTIDGQGFKSKLYHYPHVSKFRFGPSVRFGYGAIMLTGFYSVSTFFQTGKGLNDINAFSLGLTISPF